MSPDGLPSTGSYVRDRWHGYFPAVVTPFDDRHAIDYTAFTHIVAWLIDEGVHGIAVAGTTGEWQSLTLRERVRLFEAARASVPSTRLLIAGCSAFRVEETIYYLHAGCDAGFDTALITVPPYVCPTEAEAIAFFQGLADRSPLPFIVYNWPQGTGIDLSLDALSQLAAHPQVAGIKNSTPDRIAFKASVRALANRTRLYGIMPGQDGLSLLQTYGGAGCIGAAGVVARAQAGFYDAVADGDVERARRLGRFDEILMHSFFAGFRGRFAHAIPTFKHLLALRGLPSGTVRPPLLPVTSAQMVEIERLVAETDLFSDG